MRLPALLALLVSLAVSACNSGGGGNKVPELPPRKNPLDQLILESKRPDIQGPRKGYGEEFAVEDRKFMAAAFRTFMLENATTGPLKDPETGKLLLDPQTGEPMPRRWPFLKRQWVAKGPRATNALVENLFIYTLASQNSQREDSMEWARRSQAELVDLGEKALPYLVETLKIDTFTDRTGKKQKLDDFTRQTAAETAVLIGPAAAGPLVETLRTCPMASRRVIAKALIELPGPPATGALLRLLDDESFVVAAQAAISLRTHPGTNVTARLVAVFSDTKRDRTVREKAGTCLLRRRDPSAVPALVTVLDKAKTDADFALLNATGRILRATTGLRVENDPAAWRRALAERK